ncbi:MAG: serine/threonine-protein kinase [Cyanobacteria bacterium P01_D01_bin.128]
MSLLKDTEALPDGSRLSRRQFTLTGWNYWFTGACLLAVTAIASLGYRPIQLWDRQMQTLFFELRGELAAPDDIVIVAIDEESLSQGEHYQADPSKNPALAAINQWPWPRATYGMAIERLLEAGAEAVALDLVLAAPSSYGPEDDAALKAILNRYGDRVVLAATYGANSITQGDITEFTLPNPVFLESPVHIGIIQFPVEVDGRIHRQGYTYLDQQRRLNADIDAASTIEDGLTTAQSFAQATLQAANQSAPVPRGDNIFFYGGRQAFKHIPFWQIIDPDPWQNQLQSGDYFEGKIVLIGPTFPLSQDFHPAPFSESFLYPFPMAGVEILANDVATARAGNAVVSWGAQPWQQGLTVILFGVGVGLGLRYIQRPLLRLSLTVAGMFLWFGVSYVAFVAGNVFVPMGAPMGAIAIVGVSNFMGGLVSEQLQKQKLRSTLAQYVTSPVVQEIISQQNDLQDLLKERAEKVVGRVLGDRYLIVSLLGAGGFSETYVAQDQQRPQHPICVVKQLKIVSDKPKVYALAQRMFSSEAETLERLGQHNQIPRLLAYFSVNHSFYLVQEMVEGELFRDELARCKPLSQHQVVVDLLQGLLPVVAFVHEQGVIHRDIKPSNIIRRRQDNRLVLIDFGAVKQISTELTDTDVPITSTIGIGTQGYMPSEQSSGIPNLSSDIYALGVTAIEALTGSAPKSLERDGSGELLWMHRVPYLNSHLAAIVTKMVRYNFTQRYPSASEVLSDLAKLNLESLPKTAAKTLRSSVRAIASTEADHSGAPASAEPDDITADTQITDATYDGTTQILPEDWYADAPMPPRNPG